MALRFPGANRPIALLVVGILMACTVCWAQEPVPAVLRVPVDFPGEMLKPVGRAGVQAREVRSNVRLPAGTRVEVLHQAGPGCMIRETSCGRVVWTLRDNLDLDVSAATPRTAAQEAFSPFRAESKVAVRLPARMADGTHAGSVGFPAGTPMDVIDGTPTHVLAVVRGMQGWVPRGVFAGGLTNPVTALWSKPELVVPAPASHGVAETPVLKTKVPFVTSKSHCYSELVPLQLTARVLARQHYPVPGQKGGFWSTEVMPVDFALAWGPFLDGQGVQARMGYRSASFGFCDRRATLFTGNFHMVCDDPEVRKALRAVQPGEVLRLEGALIRLEHPRDKATPAQSTLTGSYCYTMLCRKIERLPRGSSAVSEHAKVPSPR